MILIVDDTPENIYSLKALLTLHSFPVDTASGGEEALKKILNNSYALIILDVQMPDMDGFEVASIISGYSKSKDIPIIFLTAANTDKQYITKGYSSGGVDYITKPIDSDILLLKVKTMYRIYEQSRRLNEIHLDLLQEIDQRKKAEKAAQEKAAELHSTLESIPQIAFTITADGGLEYTNSKWLQYSSSPSEYPPTHPEDIDLQKAIGNSVMTRKPFETEIRLRRHKSEVYRCHLLRVMPVLENNEIVKWAGTFTDIEDQKQIAEKKDEFISIASHELKTPLTSIKSYLQLLERESTGNTPFSLYVNRTLSQVKKLDGLIADLLDISKLENGKLLFEEHAFDFDRLVNNQVEMFSHTYPDYNITRVGEVGRPIYGNEPRLEQVLINFLNNAIKYSPEKKEIIVETKILEGDKLFASVTDFGIGIHKEEQQKLFDKFYRAPQASSGFQGMGIGLYICAEIIHRHHGTFGVESEPGKGATFYFTIPLHKTNQ
jgi:signal transduction histidine kinase/DNA-binding response OmpR family regulator